MMDYKKLYYETVKDFFRVYFLKIRQEYGLTQAQMTESLYISLRQYQNIESGKSLCDTTTFTTFAIVYADSMTTFRAELEQFLRKREADFFATV